MKEESKKTNFSTKNLIWIVALILIIVLIGVISVGYYKKATMKVENPIATMEVENFGTIKSAHREDQKKQLYVVCPSARTCTLRNT